MKLKSWIGLQAMSLAPTMLFAGGLTCGYLNITLINSTANTCLLKTSTIYNGSLADGSIPTTIASGEMTSSFSLQQDYTSGPGMLLEYQCGTNRISFASAQNLCFLEAGSILGQVEVAHNMSISYVDTPGSYWAGLPGQITWTLS